MTDQWQIQDYKKGFQLLIKAPVQFELKTKKKSSTFILLSQQYVMHFPCIISNRTIVIKISRSDCSIRVFYYQDSNQFRKGVSVETTPLDLPLQMCDWSVTADGCCV